MPADDLELKSHYLGWKSQGQRRRHHSQETQQALVRIAQLTEELRREAAVLPTGRLFLAHFWPEYVQRISWDTLVDALINLETLARLLIKHRTRPRGNPSDQVRRAYQEMVAWALDREGYAVETTPDGTYARVMQIMLDAAGEPAPQDAGRIARETAGKLRRFKKKS